MALNPPGQYADDRNLRARQRLWQQQVPYFDVVGWVVCLAGLWPGMRVLDAGAAMANAASPATSRSDRHSS